ncbi:MAG TPA: protein translocase subunit SecD, partial [Agromyces sp.]|nr:protein translocase subunit SecD [Agromyces sp.]
MAAPSKRSSRPAPVRKAWRSLTWLGVVIALLFGINAAAVIWGGGSWTPKLALDLEGGTQIILAPKVETGADVSQEQLDQAVSIIRQRVDASGVSEAEINTEGDNVVVRIPGELDDQTRARIEQSAKLELRAVLLADAATNESIDPSASPEPTDDAAAEELESTPTAEPTDGSDPAWITPALQDQFDNFDCSTLDDAAANVAPADEPLVTCDLSRTAKYLLGPVEASGENIVD